MTPQNRTRRAGGSHGFLEVSFGKTDAHDLKPTQPALQAQNRLRRQRLVESLHALGAPALGHFLREVEAATGIDVTRRLERYAGLPADFIRAYGGDRFPPALIAIDGRPD